MTGFFSWLLIIVGVLAIFNAEKLPALKEMLEEKFKDSVDAAKEGSTLAKNKIKQVKKDIEAKKESSAKVENEENTPEEIEESLKFMGDYVEKNENQKNADKAIKNNNDSAKAKENDGQPKVKKVIVRPKKADDGPVDLNKNYK